MRKLRVPALIIDDLVPLAGRVRPICGADIPFFTLTFIVQTTNYLHGAQQRVWL